MAKFSDTMAFYNNAMPTGTVATFGSSPLPIGYLACDGTAVSRSTFKNLFNAIGVTYGAGDGSTTFNLPDLRGIFIRGAGSQAIGITYDGGTVGTKAKDKTNHAGMSATTTSTNSATVGDSPSQAHTHSYSDRYYNQPNNVYLSLSLAAVFNVVIDYSNNEVARTTGNPNVSLNHTHTPLVNTVASTTTITAEDNETAPGAITVLYGIRI